MSTPPPTAADPALTDVAEIEHALTRISYLTSRVRQHERLMALAGLPLDRAAVALLRQVADSGSLRPSELANLLSVEASHVTRQVQQLEKTGYLTRVPDPNDRRAQRIELTPAGRDAVDRVREASCRGMSVALADWSPGDLEQLATLCHRLVDDFFAHAEDEIDLTPEAPREA
ncbi:MarR family winged helix-turn-helix transcriptional regulator [Streptomyces olivochromogenes]|uniref:MarR family transcriptional regulator n=1 Tax=Streptomyces olivochromogenes TaxID=1963 RepID=A0A250VKE6_STROL|nr:MarR family transcriptional regulator [Streptomyces olivochromogenes]KUN42326.1 MarR family transcriptional regulator [Streptomyces olivochromogenes]GAX54677.1 MarR family transcriptional regulator [Streptomyces olivochromogenes]